MCGRFSLTADVKTLAGRFSLDGPIPAPQRRYNIAPGAPILGIASNEGQRRAGLFQWGLIPPYEQNKPNPKRLVNVRIETLLERPAFLPLRQRRVLVPADAFFEWKKDGNRKLPYKIGLKENALFGLAAVSWPALDKNQRPTLTLAILTTGGQRARCQTPHSHARHLALGGREGLAWPGAFARGALRAASKAFPRGCSHSLPRLLEGQRPIFRVARAPRAHRRTPAPAHLSTFRASSKIPKRC